MQTGRSARHGKGPATLATSRSSVFAVFPRGTQDGHTNGSSSDTGGTLAARIALVSPGARDQNPHKLPERFAADVQFTCFVSTVVEETLHEHYPWRTSKAHLLRLVHFRGTRGPRRSHPPGLGFKRRVSERSSSSSSSTAGVAFRCHRGGTSPVLVVEMWRLRDDVEQELAELVDGAQPQQPYEARMALGALANGWHFALQRPREDNRPVLRIARPQDTLARQYFSASVMEQLHRLNATLTVETGPLRP